MTKFTQTNAGRAISHALLAAVLTLLPLLTLTSVSTLKASLAAALPAVANAAFSAYTGERYGPTASVPNPAKIPQ